MPTRFPGYFEELTPFLHILKGLPASIEELTLSHKSDSTVCEHICSLLWVIYQTCSSESMKKVIAKPEYLEVILKHALLAASESIIVIAFRIIRSMVPTHHSPQTFASICNSV